MSFRPVQLSQADQLELYGRQLEWNETAVACYTSEDGMIYGLDTDREMFISAQVQGNDLQDWAFFELVEWD